jgi:hypothetical protein
MKRNTVKILLIAFLIIGMNGCSNNDTAVSMEKSASMQTAAPEVKLYTAEEIIASGGGIKDMLEQYGIKAGTCLSDVMLLSGGYKDIIKANFNSKPSKT